MESNAVKNRVVRIGNAGGYWGDDPYALRRQIQGSISLNYISIDYLAEITMSILQKQKSKDPKNGGYARDFVLALEDLLEECVAKKITIITNAGGVNPRACADAIFQICRKKKQNLSIAIVDGDNILDSVSLLRKKGDADFQNMETGEDFSQYEEKVLSANVYFGARPVVEALKHKPNIIICGRVTDTGITLAPLIHEFGWSEDDYDKLAAGIVAGHIIECGAQATGGNFTDWKKVKSFVDMGFPIIECVEDGSFEVTKNPESGGLVSTQTLREQLLYEMGSPISYVTPDVIADFSSIQLQDVDTNRVKVSGIKGRKPTDFLKVSIAYADGYKSSGSLIISGPDALDKARVFAEVFWTRLDKELKTAGFSEIKFKNTEFVGWDSTHTGLMAEQKPLEILLKLSVRAQEKDQLKVFRKLLPSLILSGPAGVAVTGGAPGIHDVVSYWPALIPQSLTKYGVTLCRLSQDFGDMICQTVVSEGEWLKTGGKIETTQEVVDPHLPAVSDGFLDSEMCTISLMEIAHARSGDKGDTVNIGLIGRSAECYVWLRENITARMVANWFQSLTKGNVQRYLVPNLWALNFLLEESLGGGGTMSLQIDAQGKTFSQALLRYKVVVPKELLETISQEDRACPGELVGGGPEDVHALLF